MQPTHNPDFDAALAAGLQQHFAHCPELATFAGLTRHDAALPSATADGLAARLVGFDAWAKKLAGFDPDTLAPDQVLDARALTRQAALLRFGLETLKIGEWLPDALGDLGNLFFMMSFAAYPEEATRWQNVAARLEAVPQWLADVRARVTRPEPRACRTATESGEGFPLLLRALIQESARVAPGAVAERVAAAAAKAELAVGEQLAWYRAHGEGPERWSIGPEALAELVRLKGIPYDLAEIEAIGEDILARLEAERAALAEEIAPGQGWQAALALLRKDAPDGFPAALGLVRDLVAESRAFVRDRNLVGLPDDDVLDVVETPEFMRPLTPFAAIFPAQRFAPVQRGIYVMTPPADASEPLDAHRADLHNVVTHEGYPGHHVQFLVANRHCSSVRSIELLGFPQYAGLAYGTDLVEGWAHYCELLMKEHGFHTTPADRFVLVNDALWRAVRVLLDVRLHTGRLSADAATETLAAKTGMSPRGAAAEVNRYTVSPTYQMSYCLGKHLILGFKDEYRQAAGAGFVERTFHDMLLRGGCLPVADIRTAWREGLLA